MSEFSIEARGVSCERDQRLLLDGVNCAVGPGEVLQIAGANGSGKTTLLRILVGISTAYEGQVLWCGQPIAAAAGQYYSQLLYLGHNPGVTLTLSALENLRWYFQLNQIVADQRMREALAALGLDGYEDVPAYRMSAGQQRRIALARLLISDAPPFEKSAVSNRPALVEESMERFAQGIVQCTHRAPAFSRGDFRAAVHRNLDRGMGAAGQILVLLDSDPEGFQFKMRLELFGEFLNQDFERSVGDIELIPLFFEVFYACDDLAAVEAIGTQIEAELAGLVFDIALAGEVGD